MVVVVVVVVVVGGGGGGGGILFCGSKPEKLNYAMKTSSVTNTLHFEVLTRKILCEVKRITVAKTNYRNKREEHHCCHCCR